MNKLIYIFTTNFDKHMANMFAEL